MKIITTLAVGGLLAAYGASVGVAWNASTVAGRPRAIRAPAVLLADAGLARADIDSPCGRVLAAFVENRTKAVVSAEFPSSARFAARADHSARAYRNLGCRAGGYLTASVAAREEGDAVRREAGLRAF